MHFFLLNPIDKLQMPRGYQHMIKTFFQGFKQPVSREIIEFASEMTLFCNMD